jgi:hypothetical protein
MAETQMSLMCLDVMSRLGGGVEEGEMNRDPKMTEGSDEEAEAGLLRYASR